VERCFFFGVGSIVLYYLKMEFIVLMWIDHWGQTVGWDYSHRSQSWPAAIDVASRQAGGEAGVKYLRMDGGSRQALLSNLRTMPEYLAERSTASRRTRALRPGPANTFSPVEQCWHLADLEREGFGERMRRLRAESSRCCRTSMAKRLRASAITAANHC